MSKYRSFIHIERLGKECVEGILDGICEITPKLDGTNAVVWADFDNNGTLQVYAGSRTRALTLEDDNAGFCKWLNSSELQAERLRSLLAAHPNWIVYGEWGVGKVAAIKDYDEDAKDHLWVFDVYDSDQEHYLHYQEWLAELVSFGLGGWVVPVIVADHPTMEQIQQLAKTNKFLLGGANHAGEGVVIRNYDYRDNYGHYQVAKFVLDEYKQRKAKPKTPVDPSDIVQGIIENYCTDAEISKAVSKICLLLDLETMDLSNNKAIGMTLQMVWKESILDECADWVKKYKTPVVDFSALRNACFARVRKYIGL